MTFSSLLVDPFYQSNSRSSSSRLPCFIFLRFLVPGLLRAYSKTRHPSPVASIGSLAKTDDAIRAGYAVGRISGLSRIRRPRNATDKFLGKLECPGPPPRLRVATLLAALIGQTVGCPVIYSVVPASHGTITEVRARV